MVKIGLGVPVYKNFEGFTRLMASVDTAVSPFVIPNYDDNIGVSRGWNEAIRRAIDVGIDLLLISNDDVVFEPNCINALAYHMSSTNEIDLLTATNIRYGIPDADGIQNTADFSCFMIRPGSFVARFGTFDERFSPAYFEDNDMAYRIDLLGGRYGQLVSAHMHHAGSVTQNFDGVPVVTSEMFEANRMYYAVKWGGVVGFEQYTAPFNGVTGKTPKDW